MTFAKYVETRILVECFNGICKASDWTNDFNYKIEVPEDAFEKSNDYLPSGHLLSANSIVTEADLIDFKNNNPRVKWVVVYGKSMDDYNEMLNLRFKINGRNLAKYYNFLLKIDKKNRSNLASAFANYSSEVFNEIKKKNKYFKEIRTENSSVDMLSIFTSDTLYLAYLC